MDHVTWNGLLKRKGEADVKLMLTHACSMIHHSAYATANDQELQETYDLSDEETAVLVDAAQVLMAVLPVFGLQTALQDAIEAYNWSWS